jgi:small-conductance mechanosensitive channel
MAVAWLVKWVQRTRSSSSQNSTCISVLFFIQTILIVALIGSPFRPVFRPKELQLLARGWWALAARQLIGLLALPAALRKTAKENKILSDTIAACIYVCSGLAMMGFVFGLSLQGIVATSGVLAIVLGLALQKTLGDIFSGLSLSVEKPYDVGDAILLEGGVEGEVIEINWRSTPSGTRRTMSSLFRIAQWQKCGFKTRVLRALLDPPFSPAAASTVDLFSLLPRIF